MILNARFFYLLLFMILSQSIPAQTLQPFFDAHVHYKWDQAEMTSPQQALDILDKAGVQKAVVIGRPADLALQLQQLAPERIIPIYGPYRTGNEKLTWQFRTELIEEVRQGLSSGRYRGIGELHLIGGMAIPWQQSKVFVALLALAREYDVPIMVHSEYSSIKPTISICQGNPNNRIILAHAGAVINPDQIEEILQACPNVVMDLAARDPWRYVNNPITDQSGQLLPNWRALILRYADRFMVGSDPVWPVDKGSSWDEPDSGWRELGRFINFHRQWLSFMPEDVEKKIRWENAQTWFSSHGSEKK
jgi:predicted TIM-barrel fold metal-dependent hydrolase